MTSQSINIQRPGARGISGAHQRQGDNFDFCIKATNCVIDKHGALATRGGFTNWLNADSETREPGALGFEGNIHTVEVGKNGADFLTGGEAEFVYYIVTGTSGADKTIYAIYRNDSTTAGNSPIFEIGQTVKANDVNDWQFTNMYDSDLDQIIVIGGSNNITPIYWDFSGTYSGSPDVPSALNDFDKLVTRHSVWSSATYAVGDTVKASVSPGGDHPRFYMYCSTAGTTAGSEPTWNPVHGNTITDGSVVWTYVEMPAGGACHYAFGRLWMSNRDGTILYFSGINQPHKFFGVSGGRNDLKASEGFTGGRDNIVAITSFQNNLIVFGKESTLIFNNDPTSFALQEFIPNVGCRARDSVENIGTDVLWLDETGLRSLNRNALYDGGRLDQHLPSRHNRVDLVGALDSASKPIKSVYDHIDGNYILIIDDTIWVFDLKFPMEDGTFRTTKWDVTNFGAWNAGVFDHRYDQLIMAGTDGSDGVLAIKSGVNDVGNSYTVDWLTSWNNLGSPNKKQFKSINYWVGSGWGNSIVPQWSFDFNDNTNNLIAGDTFVIPVLGANSTFVNGFTQQIYSNTGSNEFFAFGANYTVSTTISSFTFATINLTLGRLNR